MTRQMSLDELPPVSRTSDPDTSRQAPTDTSRRTVMAALFAAVQQRPMTTEEAADVAGIDHWQATKRMSDLRNTEQVKDSGERRKGKSGRAQIVWRVPGPCTCSPDHTGEDIIVNPSCDRHGGNR